MYLVRRGLRYRFSISLTKPNIWRVYFVMSLEYDFKSLCKSLIVNNQLTTGLVSERCFVFTYSFPPVCNLSFMLFLSSASFILFLSPGFGLFDSTFGSIILISLIRSLCNGPSLPALSSKDELLSASKLIIKSYLQ